MAELPTLPDGLVAFVSVECATCNTLVPVFSQLRTSLPQFTLISQDDPQFPPGADAVLDHGLELSYRSSIETVPTLLRVRGGVIEERLEGWYRPAWRAATGVDDLGSELPEHRPGCGSRTLDAGVFEDLVNQFGNARLHARRVEIPELEDEIEACFERGWSDGLPVVPPTPARVFRMLEGTSRDPGDVLGEVPPDMAAVTVEKVAIAAVMAGCRPEYLPVVLAAVEASLVEEYHMHGLIATSHPAGPVIVVNGPIAAQVGMNSGANVLGQGNRANATIGRALQLVVRNVGGGRPGEVDRACMGNPGKYTFCFAENERDSPWEPLSVERGFAAGVNTVTLFAGEGPRLVRDETSRSPESLARSFAACLRTNSHPKQGFVEPPADSEIITPAGTNWCAWPFDTLMVISPDHARTFRESRWTKAMLREFLMRELTIPGAEMVRGFAEIDEGLPEEYANLLIPKFRATGLNFVHAGGAAGFFSAIISGRLSAPQGTDVVTKEIRP